MAAAAAAAAATAAAVSSSAAARSLAPTKEFISAFVPKSSRISSAQSLSIAVPSPKPPARRRRRHRETSSGEFSELLTPDEAPTLLRWCRLLRLAVHHRDLELLRAVHAALAKEEADAGDETLILNSLVAGYLKLGQISDARKVFEGMLRRDVVSYSSLISAYARSGEPDEALKLFLQMRIHGICPNSFALVAIFTACIRDPDSRLSSQLHAIAVKLPDQSSELHVQNALMAAYFRSGFLDLAEQVFNRMESKDTISWNTVISGMINHGMQARALEIFQEMREAGMNGDSFTISSVLSFSAMGMHAHAVKTGLELELSVCNSLISFYTGSGSLEEVRSVFDRMPERDLFSWNGMIRAFMVFGEVESAIRVYRRSPLKNGISYNILLAGFLHNGDPFRALKLFLEMVEGEIEVSDFTLAAAIAAAGKLGGAAAVCEQIHGFAAKSGGGSGDWVAAALLDMYASSGKLPMAEKIFQRWDHDQSRAIAFTSLISGYTDDLQLDKALDLFRQMQIESPEMDKVALTAGFSLCAELGFLAMGEQLHAFLCKSGDLFPDSQIWNSLLSMYAKCGDLEKANKIFSSMTDHDTVSWNALISAHLLHRRGDETLNLWKSMEEKGAKPDVITARLLIAACKYTSRISIHDLLKLAPTPANYAAAAEAMSAAGELEQAAELARTSPESHHAWRALLRRNSGGIEAARSFLTAPPANVAAYVLASNLYAAAGRWRCAEEVRKEMKEKGLRKRPVRSWFISNTSVHSFYSRDRSHENSKDIYACLEILIAESLKNGYEPDTRFVLQEVEEFQKREFVFFHGAKLAAAYGHLTAPPGRAIRVVKNVRLCGDCHSFFKVFSVVTRREVLVRDSTGFHCFRDGCCSCSDRW